MSTQPPAPSGTDQAELLDPQAESFLACPYAAYADARKSAPVVHQSALDEWIVVGRDEIESVQREHGVFTSRYNLDGSYPFSPEARAILDDSLFFRVALYNVEPPAHTRFRTLISEYFSPRNLRALEPAVRRTADRLAGGILGSGRADLLQEFAYPLPMTVICDIIGIPEEDRAQVKEWNNQWLALQVVPLPVEQQVHCAKSVVEYENYVLRLLRERRDEPADDLLTVLGDAAAEEDPVCAAEDVVVALRVMIAAGHETTTNLIGNTVWHLLEDRGLWESLVRDPALIPAAVEEGLRFDSSVQGAPRVATEAVRVGGAQIPAGGQVRVMFAAAGRDPEWVEDPDTFRLDRQGPPRHLGFGHGIHFCVGAGLARLETRIALETLTGRFPSLRLEEGFTPQHLPGGFVFRGMSALPVIRA
ncbi:cytochrome P450 [Streptomyces sp. N2-109]|uniref:Cytochrome P450 n=1 Tax=Streptomyces gossypii TaxID=2883101 RepID=A0ABT2JZF1_9ACTN|nr:cytochrome P450 [Streptomyces gossypii]MCT2593280.1 cytochrome P450 [Streptomyces gossypii]